MHPLLDFASIGGAFILALLAPAALADQTLLDDLKDAPLLILGGGVGMGGAISLLTPGLLELGLWAFRFLDRRGRTQADQTYEARMYALLSRGNSALVDWTMATRQEAQATINGGVAVLLGGIGSFSLGAGGSSAGSTAAAVAVLLGVVCCLSGLRRHRDARRIEAKAGSSATTPE